MGNSQTTETINNNEQKNLNHLFCRAVDQGDLQKAGQLLKEGANIDASGALMYTQDLKITDWLIKNGADVNAQYGGWTPLHWAAARNDLPKAEFLIKNGAKVNARGDANTTPVHEAAARGSVEALEFLIQNGADVTVKNSLDWTVLHEIAANYLRGDTSNDKKIIEIAIKAGVDINAQDIYGNTALNYASYPGTEEMMDLLLEQGAGANSSLTFFGDVFNQFC